MTRHMDLWTFHLKRKKSFFLHDQFFTCQFLSNDNSEMSGEKKYSHLESFAQLETPIFFPHFEHVVFYSGKWLKFICLHGFFSLHLLAALTLSAFPNVYSPLSSLLHNFQLPYDLCMSCIETKRDTPAITCCWTWSYERQLIIFLTFSLLPVYYVHFFQVL